MHQLLVFGSAFGAGMINSVAGGGTLLSFPTLIWLGVPSVTANATCLLAAQEAIQRRVDLSAIHTSARSPWLSWAMLFQAGVGLYGGYFGAGLARGMGRTVVRRIIIVIGFGMALALLVKAL